VCDDAEWFMGSMGFVIVHLATWIKRMIEKLCEGGWGVEKCVFPLSRSLISDVDLLSQM